METVQPLPLVWEETLGLLGLKGTMPSHVMASQTPGWRDRRNIFMTKV